MARTSIAAGGRVTQIGSVPRAVSAVAHASAQPASSSALARKAIHSAAS